MASRIRQALLAIVLAATPLAAIAPTAAADESGWARSFYWGVATSGFQSEGDAPDSNWKRYVDANAGKNNIDPYGNAVDFRHRYPSYIQLAKNLGVNTFRLGIEWARVEPKPGVWDTAELAYYDDVIKHVTDAGMTPMITLNHFTEPGWVTDQGSWASGETISAFLDYTRHIVQRYRDRNILWITFNEPVVLLQDEIKVGAIQAWQLPWADANVITAHRRAYDLIHQLDPRAKVTSNQAFISGFNALTDFAFLDHVKDKIDYVGIDYYYGLSLDNLSAISAASGEFWKVKLQPEGIYYALREYHNRFPELPLYVVENGMPTDNGKPRDADYARADNLRDTVYWVQRAKADGMNVIGYNYWSLTDNYEWGSYRPRFGLYTIDVLTDPTLTPTPTDAVTAYTEITAQGGAPGDYRLKRQPGACSLVEPLSSCLNPADPNGPREPLK
ncbi:family 1 glycosylhydrolase [Amycolatopsis orientalis]|uniref:family 1 glycosylhydrolase n=1 Tax=Amycolatopsis orientalis TaxID=31958 RepID=UPI00039E549F|nr:family 1 glycosylhydrolase [Amycolatopsis orientalis]